ncbi:MAG: hypothetical protein IJW18_04565 [Lachnospiraceae bacterium]|nr:hypothetical protein [Lachnospiraceae bacterium]
MSFVSILGRRDFDNDKEQEFFEQPSYFNDLNLNQIVNRIIGLRIDYDLKKYYYVMPKTVEEICFRQEVLKDFYNEGIMDATMSFSNGLFRARNYWGYSVSAETDIQQKRWKIDSAYAYINAVREFAASLDGLEVVSEGMKQLKSYLKDMVESKEFNEFADETVTLMNELFDIEFTLEMERNSITVIPKRNEEHYIEKVAEMLEIPEGTKVNTYFGSPLTGALILSGVEEKIINILQKEYPESFAKIDEYDDNYSSFIDSTLVRLEEEMQFYIAYILFRKEISQYNFTFCTPEVRDAKDAAFAIVDGYDLALARKNSEAGLKTVSNSLDYRDKERFLVITGPNQGGKTTSARSMGQIAYFAMLGLDVPAASVKIPFFHGIMTHFEVEESLDTGAGKLKEELNRLKPMMEEKGQRNFIVINELFTTAASYDAYIMGSHVLKHFIELDYFGVYVTHIKELAKESETVASLVAGISELDGKTRTFKIERKASEGIGHASTLVDKYRLNYDEIKGGLLR